VPMDDVERPPASPLHSDRRSPSFFQTNPFRYRSLP
jgi:hypothetical protein